MKISYISLRKRLQEMRKRKKDNNDEEEKYIGINYSKRDNKETKLKRVASNFKGAPRGSYTLLVFMIMLLVITTKLNLDTYSKIESEDYETYTAEEQEVAAVSNDNVAIYQEAVSSVFEENENYEEVVQTTSTNIVSTNMDELEEEVYVYEYTYVRPVNGKTMKEYSMDKVVYSKTLDMWKVHDGIDIYANENEEVRASEKGIIERIYEDSFYGYSVIIDHQNGIKTIYRNLNSDILVNENQQIEKETVIGKIGNTAIGECKDESHLHFEVVQNGEIVNPSIIGIK